MFDLPARAVALAKKMETLDSRPEIDDRDMREFETELDELEGAVNNFRREVDNALTSEVVAEPETALQNSTFFDKTRQNSTQFDIAEETDESGKSLWSRKCGDTLQDSTTPPPHFVESEVQSEAFLSAKQVGVLNLLSQGETVSSAAETAGVHRTTVYYWLETNELFRNAFDKARRMKNDELLESLESSTYQLATMAIRSRLFDDDGWLALRLLESTGMLGRTRRER